MFLAWLTGKDKALDHCSYEKKTFKKGNYHG